MQGKFYRKMGSNSKLIAITNLEDVKEEWLNYDISYYDNDWQGVSAYSSKDCALSLKELRPGGYAEYTLDLSIYGLPGQTFK